MFRRHLSVVCVEATVVETLVKVFEISSMEDRVAFTVVVTLFKSAETLDDPAMMLSNFDATSVVSAEKSLFKS
jgi:hypothetical protein